MSTTTSFAALWLLPQLPRFRVEGDPHVNALGTKDVGDTGVTGTAGAIANAV